MGALVGGRRDLRQRRRCGKQQPGESQTDSHGRVHGQFRPGDFTWNVALAPVPKSPDGTRGSRKMDPTGRRFRLTLTKQRRG
jgi:hypothetical protein